jgi:hypothetical protein
MTSISSSPCTIHPPTVGSEQYLGPDTTLSVTFKKRKRGERKSKLKNRTKNGGGPVSELGDLVHTAAEEEIPNVTLHDAAILLSSPSLSLLSVFLRCLSFVGSLSPLFAEITATVQTDVVQTDEQKAEKTFAIEKLSLWEDDVNGIWFLNKWVGSEEMTVQLRENYPQTKSWRQLLDVVYEKGVGARMTKAAGRANTRSASREGGWCADKQSIQSREIGSCYEIPHLHVPFGATLENCVPFSLINVLDASKTKAKRLRKALKTTICGLSDLASVSHVLGVRLKRWPDKTMAWLLKRQKGRFLLLQSVHCIGVDCGRQYLYDSTRIKVLRLGAGSLQLCGFSNLEPVEIREVLGNLK